MVDHDENKDNNSVVVSVEDTGRGIDPEILPKLFSKFVTNSESGTGLGLFISKNIIEAHGGKMWAGNNRDNNDGKRIGATFRFSLPVSKENRTILKTEICNKSDINELGNIACI